MAVDIDWNRLCAAAQSAADRAYAPYSNIRVGAALLGEGGELYVGCNVENASYGATLCAERVALGNAVASGVRAFRAMAIASPDLLPYPCGLCRQVLAEFVEPWADLVIVLTDGKEVRKTALGALFPSPFRLG